MIKSRPQLKSFVCVASAFLLGATASPVPGPRMLHDLSKPSSNSASVLLITIDTLRADHLGCYGYSRIETPNIDRLAAGGMRFENAYAQAPITLPSHAVILTGTYPMFNGVRDFTSPGLPTSIPTLAEILRRQGYRTAAFVSSFVLNSMWGLNRGFEVYDDNVGFTADGTKNPFQLERRGDETVDRLLDWLNRRDGKPFFAWLHLYDPHSPYRPPEPYQSRYSSHLYDGEIGFDDEQIGRAIARLHALNLYESTLIILLGDHGESLGEHDESEHGFFIYNATLHVPLILKLPRAVGAVHEPPLHTTERPDQPTKGRALSEAVGTIDVAPTITQVCEIAPAEYSSFQGHSLLRSTNGSPQSREEAAYAESYYPRNSFGWHELRALVTPEFKYVDAPRAELYDLKQDPSERTNIISKNPAVAASLRERLADLERRFQSRETSGAATPLDPETLAKLKSLGYIAYPARPAEVGSDPRRADPKDKIAALNRILRAADLTQLARYGEADQLLEFLEQAEPELYVVPFQRGENFLSWGKPQEAVAEFRKSLSRNPTFNQAALGLGRAHFLLGQDAEAAQALELALHFDPHNFLARLAVAKVYWRQSRLEKAEAELAQVVETHPEFAEGHADYGIILAKLGKYRQALAEIRRGIELGYRDAITYNYLGIAQAGVGDRPQAVRAYEQAIKLDPQYAAAYLNLALEYRKQGQLAKAQGYYQEVCKLSDELCRKYAGQFPTR